MLLPTKLTTTISNIDIKVKYRINNPIVKEVTFLEFPYMTENASELDTSNRTSYDEIRKLQEEFSKRVIVEMILIVTSNLFAE